MQISRCFGCMNQIKEGVSPCPHCGFDSASYVQSLQALPLGYILNGRYLIGQVMGQGGFGITYIGFDLMLEVRVAIKEYYPAGQAGRIHGTTTVSWTSREESCNGMNQFIREARKMAKTKGIPSIVNVQDVFFDNETAYIVMDFVEGITLKTVLQRSGTKSAEDCVKLLLPMMDGLEQAHSLGLIHRDISPDNIMLDENGSVFLLDLGAAKDLDSGSTNSQLIGKKGFSPPEQYFEKGSIGPWTDVYALCATMLYAITGRVIPEAMERMVSDSLDLSGLPAPLARVLKKGLALKYEERYASVSELKADLIKALTGRDLPGPKPSSRKKRLLPLLAACFIALAAAGIFAFKESSEPRQSVPAELPQPQAAPSAKPEPAPIVTEETEETVPEPVPVKLSFIRPAEKESKLRTSYELENMDTAPFWGQKEYTRKQVTSVQFHSTMDAVPDSRWDISEAGDSSVLAWMDGTVLHAAADGPIACRDASYLFAYFSNLTSIDWGECFDTAQTESMEGMFKQCRSLTALDISGFDTSNTVSMFDMFYACSALTELDVSGFNTSKVTDMTRMFGFLRKLPQLDVSGFQTSAVTEMAEMFGGCQSLTDLNVSGFDTSSVTNMSGMFCMCSKLTGLDVSNFNTAQVTDMSGMFAQCESLTSLDVTGFDTSSVIDMSTMFYKCTHLTDLDVSGFDISKVTDMSSMFYFSKKLPKTSIPSWYHGGL